MSKKKMCGWWFKNLTVKHNRMLCCDWGKVCPQNTNAKCEIIPKKPGVVREIKGYINLASESVAHSIEKDYHHRVYSDKAGALTEACPGFDTVPCTILIYKKYLRRKP